MTDLFPQRDHGGGLDAAIAQYGGTRADWVDLSTGINPRPWPVPPIPPEAWTALPDKAAADRLEAAARKFWSVPDRAGVLAVPGASAAIARIPALRPAASVRIVARTYNEHAAAFRNAGWSVVNAEPEGAPRAEARVVVHPNNPDGIMWAGHDEDGQPPRDLMVIDESFADVILFNSRVPEWSVKPGVLVLKSLGKFWGLAGVRLGFVIGDPELIARLAEMLGPWPVSGAAQHIGTLALSDMDWCNRTRQIMNTDVARFDAMVQARGGELIGGTSMFRLFRVEDAAKWQAKLARGKVWTRTFPYEPTWLRFGIPPVDRWDQVERAFK